LGQKCLLWTISPVLSSRLKFKPYTVWGLIPKRLLLRKCGSFRGPTSIVMRPLWH
jgi:hypothetical protein